MVTGEAPWATRRRNYAPQQIGDDALANRWPTGRLGGGRVAHHTAVDSRLLGRRIVETPRSVASRSHDDQRSRMGGIPRRSRGLLRPRRDGVMPDRAAAQQARGTPVE
jgi:hypothetical protein